MTVSKDENKHVSINHGHSSNIYMSYTSSQAKGLVPNEVDLVPLACEDDSNIKILCFLS